MDTRKNYSQHEKEIIKRELNEKLYKMYIIKNRQDYTGSIEKYECVINNERGMFKERISAQSKDHIMEQVAYELSLLLGVKCCKASCRKTNGIYGSFSRFKVVDMNNVVQFENMTNKQEMHTEELLQYTINLTHDSKNNFVINLYQYIIFDYILGQHDRHLENIAIYRKNNNRIV